MSIRKFENQSLQKILVPMLIVGFISSFLMGLTSDIYHISILFFLMGFTTTIIGITTQIIIQLQVIDNYRARVLTWWSSISFGSLTIGGIILGIFGEYFPLEYGIIFMSISGYLFFRLFYTKFN